MAFINRDDITIHYQWLNQHHHQTIVFINSLGTHLTIWHEVVALLEHQFNILLFDKRGHGLSSTIEGTLSIDDYADDVIFLMDELGVERANVIGLSIGGLITYSLANRFPSRLDKLVFSNTGAKLGNETAWNDRIEAIQKDGMASMSSSIIERWLSPNYRATHSAETLGYKMMLDRCTKLGYIQACAAIRDADYNSELKKINHPTLFMGGGVDIGTPPEMVKENAENLGAEAVIFDDIGHLPCIEIPLKMADLIQAFLSDPAPQMHGESYKIGMKTRRAVLGNAHVDRAETNKTEFDEDFQRYITTSAWGAIWSRKHLSKRERSMITIALLAALGHEQELEMHIRATKNTGATEKDIKEVLLHTGIYAGVPVTNGAMKIAKRIYSEFKDNQNEL